MASKARRDYKGFHFTTWGVCKGQTKSGKACGQSSIYPNGFCRHHGGKVTKKDFEAHKTRILEKMQRKSERLARRHARVTAAIARLTQEPQG